jgi:hypothetical protein
MAARFVSVFVAAVAIFSCTEAMAQRPFVDERASRAAVVPYVRAATGCIARVVLTHPRLLELYRANNFDALIAFAAPSCRSELATMSAMHDRFYYPGKGNEFLRGPYAADLPRAINQRIKGEVAKREAARRFDSAAREHALEKAHKTLNDCLLRETALMLGSTESADTVAGAAITLCRSGVEAVQKAIVDNLVAKFGRADGVDPEDIRNRIHKARREELIAVIIRARSASVPTQHSSATTPMGDLSQHTGRVVECIKTAGQALRSKLTPTDTKVSAVLEVCRAEIEGEGRARFLSKLVDTLDEGRLRSFVRAKEQAQKVIGE